MPVDSHLQQIMQGLGNALAQAIGKSPEVGDAIRKAHLEGYSLFLVLEKQEEDDRSARIELSVRKPSAKEPSFRLDKVDVSLLKAMGIDPTRSSKRRRSS